MQADVFSKTTQYIKDTTYDLTVSEFDNHARRFEYLTLPTFWTIILISK